MIVVRIFRKTYNTITGEKSHVQPARLDLGPDGIFVRSLPWQRNDLRIILPRFLLENGGKEQSQVLLVSTLGISMLEYELQTFRRVRHRPNNTVNRLLPLHAIGHLRVRHTTMTGFDTVEEVESRRDPNRATLQFNCQL